MLMSRLYLVDDHTVMREGLRSLLESSGHVVVGEASDPTPALAAIATLAPDIVLLDLNLGLRSGLEVLAELSKRHIQSRVIVLTMSNQPRHVAEAIRLGAFGYVLKGAPSDQLLLAIETVASGRRHLASEEAELAVRGLTAAAGQDLESLSPRERQILVMVARGATSASIGEELHLSPKTVDTYRSRLMAKLGLGDVPAIVRWAIRNQLIGVDEL
jgi:DNA-binding NarL/FixJ family response regulator